MSKVKKKLVLSKKYKEPFDVEIEIRGGSIAGSNYEFFTLGWGRSR